MADFRVLGNAVRRRFNEMSQEQLFVVDYDKNLLWEKYLSAFPEGSNPIFITRTEHDCACCRHFIRDIGSVVAIQNGALVSVWDVNGLPEHYQTVADTMSEYVKSLPIKDMFFVKNAKFGNESTKALINGKSLTFYHFYVEAGRQFVTPKVDELKGTWRTTFEVFRRGITEIKPEAVATVLSLIKSNSIYRGQEFKTQVLEFQRLQQRWKSLGGNNKDYLLWSLVKSSAARIRNTVIGTLLQDLSGGVDLEAAVRSFESKVAPTNYKRTTALITEQMINDAMKTLEELDLESALERRHAKLSDVSVNSVLFVDNAVQGKMKDGLKGLLLEEVKSKPIDIKKTEEIDIDSFIDKVLPKATSLQVYLENNSLPNFVSLTAPVHEDSKSLFRWDNDFAWSYDGNVTDSIKDKVKRAGGRVENVALRVSLAWFNFDDLDLHIHEPNGNHIYYVNRSNILDVDMNAGGPQTREPVENMRWIRLSQSGTYKVSVHNFRKRESIDVGFVVEIESPHGLESFKYEKGVSQSAYIPVADIVVAKGQVTIKPAKGVVAGSVSQEKWGVKTLDLVRVNSVVLSPNYWDKKEGNKHWFFILEGCKNPEPTRGIYNEFLHPRLEKHRKVFEILGDKTKCPVADEQLSGVGYSSTRKDKVTVVVNGPTLNKAYTIVFGKESVE